jgi:hypothetical protein
MPLARNFWDNTMMRHLNKGSPVNQQTIEEVTLNGSGSHGNESCGRGGVITDLALFGVEAVERGLSTYNQNVPLLHQTTPSNIEIRHLPPTSIQHQQRQRQ